MLLSADQMKRQKAFESSLFHIQRLHAKGILTDDEYRQSILYLEKIYNPIIKH